MIKGIKQGLSDDCLNMFLKRLSFGSKKSGLFFHHFVNPLRPLYKQWTILTLLFVAL